MSEFQQAKVSTVQVKIDTTAAGNIAQSGDITAGTKKISISGISATANLADTMQVFNVFYGESLAGGSVDELTAVKTTTQGVTI